MTRKPESGLSQDKALAGVLALLVAEREERLGEQEKPPRTEILLANAGLTAAEIATLLGKSLDAVRKTIQRAKKS